MNSIIKSLSIVLTSCILSGCGSTHPFIADGVQNYNKTPIIEKYSHSLDSNLSIFPDEIKAIDGEATYHAYISDEFFNDNPEVFLQCKYSKENYDKEVDRIKSIEMTITFRDQSHTNYVKYDEEMYAFPAYIAIDGFSSKYEYALLNEEENMITYMYLSYPGNKQFTKYEEYIKKDKSSYNHAGLDCFTIYAHSFDGGRSYVEFDD